MQPVERRSVTNHLLHVYSRNCCKLYIAIFGSDVWHYIRILCTENLRVAQVAFCDCYFNVRVGMHVLCNSICHNFKVLQ